MLPVSVPLGGLRRAAAAPPPNPTVKASPRHLIHRLRAGGTILSRRARLADTSCHGRLPCVEAQLLLLGLRGRPRRGYCAAGGCSTRASPACGLRARTTRSNPCAACRAQTGHRRRLPPHRRLRATSATSRSCDARRYPRGSDWRIDPIKRRARAASSATNRRCTTSLPRSKRGIPSTNCRTCGKFKWACSTSQKARSIKGYPSAALTRAVPSPPIPVLHGTRKSHAASRTDGSDIRTHYAATPRARQHITRRSLADRRVYTGVIQGPTWCGK